METKEWITLGVALLSALLLIVSWFVINWLNRKNEIAKERMKFRVDILLSVLAICDEAQKRFISNDNNIKDKDFTLKFVISVKRMRLFGSAEEISICDSVHEKVGSKEPMGKELNELQNLVVARLKQELKITP